MGINYNCETYNEDKRITERVARLLTFSLLIEWLDVIYPNRNKRIGILVIRIAFYFSMLVLVYCYYYYLILFIYRNNIDSFN